MDPPGNKYTKHTLKLIIDSRFGVHTVRIGKEIDLSRYSYLDLCNKVVKHFIVSPGKGMFFVNSRGDLIENDADVLALNEKFSDEYEISIHVVGVGCPLSALPAEKEVILEVSDGSSSDESITDLTKDVEVEVNPEAEPANSNTESGEPANPNTESQPVNATPNPSTPVFEPQPETKNNPSPPPIATEPQPQPETENNPSPPTEPASQNTNRKLKPKPQPQPETQTDSVNVTQTEPASQNTKGTQAKKKRTEKTHKLKEDSGGNTRKRYKLRKRMERREDYEEEFIVSDEDFEHSEDEDFEMPAEEGCESSSDDDDETGNASEDERVEMMSDCPDSSEGEELASGDDAGLNRRQRKAEGCIFDGIVTADFQFEVRQIFRDIKHLKEVLEDYISLGGYNIICIKNDHHRLTVMCGEDGCQWRMHVSKTGDKRTMMVKKISKEHACVRNTELAIVNPKWITKVMKEQLKDQPNMHWKAIQDYLRRECKVEAKQGAIYKAKRWARLENNGSLEESFSKLHGYAQVLKRVDPGTVVKFHFEEREDFMERPTFKRMFVAFNATVWGFLHGCRPFFGVDGTHLTGEYKAILLTAVSVDGNKGTYPIAFCIVEGETTKSWVWFLECLKDCIGEDNNGTPYTIMSDKQKGLIRAVKDVFPSAYSRFCTRHLYANLKKECPGLDIHEIFWLCTRATNLHEFEVAMDWMRKVSEAAYDWLKEKPADQWSRFAYDTTSKNVHRTNNMAESFNNELKELRKMDPIKMIEELRRQLLTRFYKRYSKAMEMEDNKVTKDCKAKLNKLVAEARGLRLIPGRNEQFEVLEGPNQFSINLAERTCSCNYWAIAGLPCRHAVKALLFKRADLEDYCSPYYSQAFLLQAYYPTINSIPTSALASAPMDVKIRPPLNKKLPGRPKVCRIREPNERVAQGRSTMVTCSKCGKTGHNQRTCEARFPRAKKKTGRGGKTSVGGSSVASARGGLAATARGRSAAAGGGSTGAAIPTRTSKRKPTPTEKGASYKKKKFIKKTQDDGPSGGASNAGN